MLPKPTVTKLISRSQRWNQQDTVKPQPLRCKTQTFTNEHVLMLGQHEKHSFRVFSDFQVGITINVVNTVPLYTDEDRKTTESVLQYGQRLCVRDLRMRVNQQVHPSDGSSQFSYQDMG